jgi:WD40 repeat protein
LIDCRGQPFDLGTKLQVVQAGPLRQSLQGSLMVGQAWGFVPVNGIGHQFRPNIDGDSGLTCDRVAPLRYTKQRWMFERLTSVVLSPDGQWLATIGKDGTVKIWNVTSGRDAELPDDIVGPICQRAIEVLEQLEDFAMLNDLCDLGHEIGLAEDIVRAACQKAGGIDPSTLSDTP